MRALSAALRGGPHYRTGRVLPGGRKGPGREFKFRDERWGRAFCKAADYRRRATAALVEMHRQAGDLAIDDRGIAAGGVLVRHLVMPGGVSGTPEVAAFLADALSPDTRINVMPQYRPCGDVRYHALAGRRPTRKELDEARAAVLDAGLIRIDGCRFISSRAALS